MGAAKLTLGTLEVRLQVLEAHWVKFNNYDEKLLPFKNALKEHQYVKQDVLAAAEKEYSKHKGFLLDLIRSTSAKEAVATPPANTGPIPSSAPRTILPQRIQLPTFSGKYEDWPAFRDLFDSLIAKDKSTSDVEKLHYFISCLKDESESLISNLSITGDNYRSAWSTLTAYYENKRLLSRSYLSSFLVLQKMKSESVTELRKVYHHIRSTVSSLANINRPIGNSEDLFVYMSVGLLDPRSRREWENSISSTSEPPLFNTLEAFLKQRLHTLESLAPCKPESSFSKNGGSQKTTRTHHTRKQDCKVENKRGRCSLCSKDHFLMLCEDYRKKTAQGRKNLVLEKDLCLNCLGRHKVNDCASKRSCTACGECHHSSIHDACRETKVSMTSHVAQRSSVNQVSVLLATAQVCVADRNGEWHNVRALIDQRSETSFITEHLAQLLRLSRSPISVAVFGIGGQKTGTAKDRVTLTLTSQSGDNPITVSTLILPRLTIFTGCISECTKSWTHLQGLDLADPDFRSADIIEVLLGAASMSLPQSSVLESEKGVFGNLLPSKLLLAGFCRAILRAQTKLTRDTSSNAE